MTNSFISLCTTELPQEQTIQTFCLNSSQSEKSWLKKRIALKGKERKCPVSDTAWIQGLDKGLVHNEEWMFGPWTIQSRNKIMELEISITGLPDVLRTMRRTKLQFFVNLILLRNYIHKKETGKLESQTFSLFLKNCIKMAPQYEWEKDNPEGHLATLITCFKVLSLVEEFELKTGPDHLLFSCPTFLYIYQNFKDLHKNNQKLATFPWKRNTPSFRSLYNHQ